MRPVAGARLDEPHHDIVPEQEAGSRAERTERGGGRFLRQPVPEGQENEQTAHYDRGQASPTTDLGIISPHDRLLNQDARAGRCFQPPSLLKMLPFVFHPLHELPEPLVAADIGQKWVALAHKGVIAHT
jgi:hypothetical protein